MAKVDKKALDGLLGGIGGDIPLESTPEKTAKAIAAKVKSTGVEPDMKKVRQLAKDAHKRK